MRKLLSAGVAALVGAASICAAAGPASAQTWHHNGGGTWHNSGSGTWHNSGGARGSWSGGAWRGGRDFRGFRGGFRGDDDDWGWGLGAGLAGFALGAALTSPYYYDDYGYPGYYGPYYGGYYGGYYGDCVGTRRVWDPYIGRWIWRRYYYAC